MTDYIVKTSRNIDAARLSSMHAEDAAKGKGQPMLEIKAYYYKDARVRGVYVSVSRCLVGGGFRS